MVSKKDTFQNERIKKWIQKNLQYDQKEKKNKERLKIW